VIYLKLNDGSGWMRAQRRDDKHLLVPWPVFEGWDEALPGPSSFRVELDWKNTM
jgi:hypothetical protein